jgi:DNA polymerase-3 subunit alpha
MKNISLIFDVETTGLPSKRNPIPYDFDKFEQARMIEIAYIIVNNDNGKILKEYTALIKHDTYITVDNSDIHGITTENLLMEGVPINNVLNDFSKDLETVDTIVAHNLNFDINILLSELYRKYNHHKYCIGMIYTKNSYCTMLNGQKYLNESKWPKLTYLYSKIVGKDWTQTHRALDDTKKCYACYMHLIKSKY